MLLQVSRRTALGHLLSAGALSGCASLNLTDNKIGIGAQLYTVREALMRDLLPTLQAVSDLGYRQVELAGLAGHSIEAFQAALKQTNLKAIGFHADWRAVQGDPTREIAHAKILGATTLVLAWMPLEQRQTLDQWRAWSDHANRVCELCKAAKLEFAWHNHDFEFQPVQGQVPFDILLERLNPDVKFELDVYWTQLAGINSLMLMRQLTGRVTMLHIKDMARETTAMADPGMGRLDFPAILALARKIGVTNVFVERDDSPVPLVTLRHGFDYLSALI